MKTKKKKGLHQKIEVFFFSSKSGEDQKKKKKFFTAIWDNIRPEFVGFIRAGWLLFVSSSSAQISDRQRYLFYHKSASSNNKFT